MAKLILCIKNCILFLIFDTMRIIKCLFWILWRVWFYILMGFFIIMMLPFLVISILKEEWYPYFFVMARIWGRGILLGLGCHYKIEREQELEAGKSYMLTANHTSMLDIMLMLAVTRNPFVFVGKKELAKIPLFGFFYKRTCILVDRSSPKSRHEVYEGGVPDESIVLDEFKDGAFRLAIEHQIPIVPITFGDNKKRMSYTFFSGSPGLLRAKVHHFIETKGKTLDDKKELREQTREVILKQLEEYK